MMNFSYGTITVWSFLILMLGFSSCKTSKEVIEEPEVVVDTSEDTIREPEGLLLSFSRGACFGRCPVYTLEIYQNEVARYYGKNYSDKEGVWAIDLSKAQLAKISNAAKEADFENLKTVYPSSIPDLPNSTYKYYGDGYEKSVSGKENLPESLTNLYTILDELNNSNEWKKIDGEMKEEEAELNYKEIIVRFKKGTGLSRWFMERKEMGIWLKARVSPDENLWIISYKTSMHEPEDILQKIIAEDAVESAEFNKKTSIR